MDRTKNVTKETFPSPLLSEMMILKVLCKLGNILDNHFNVADNKELGQSKVKSYLKRNA